MVAMYLLSMSTTTCPPSLAAAGLITQNAKARTFPALTLTSAMQNTTFLYQLIHTILEPSRNSRLRMTTALTLGEKCVLLTDMRYPGQKSVSVKAEDVPLRAMRLVLLHDPTLPPALASQYTIQRFTNIDLS